MAEYDRKKMTIVLNQDESAKLNSIQNSYLLAKGWFSMVPSVNDILKGMVYYTFLEVNKDGRVRRGFANRFLRRRNRLPISKDTDTTDNPRMKEIEKMMRDPSIPVLETRTVRPSAGNYSFYYYPAFHQVLDELRSEVVKISSISNQNISYPEIVRESLHFVIDKEFEYIDFRFLTYSGFLYGLSPATSVIVSYLGSKKSKEIKKFLLEQASGGEVELLRAISKDARVFKNFQNAFRRNSNIKVKAKGEKLIGKYVSEIGNFDFYLAFLGFEMNAFLTMNEAQEISLIALYLMHEAKWVLEAGIDGFNMYLSMFIDSFKNDEKQENAP